MPTEMVHETRVGPPTQVGIGGWLILPAIGLVLGPIASIVVLFKAADLYSAVSAAGYGAIYALDLLLEGSLLLFIIYAATRFFGRKTNAPVIVISVLILSLGTYAVVLAAALATGAKVFAAAAAKELARGAIAAAIWIPYFRVSKRVKATFVN